MIAATERRAAATEFLRAAEALAENTGSSEVWTIAKYLRQYAQHAAPALSPPGGLTISEDDWVYPGPRPTSLTPLRVVPLYGPDQALGERWQELYECCGNAVYWTVANLIVIRPESGETARVKGCSILHEAGHALRALVEGRLGQPQLTRTDTYYAEERDLYLLEAVLWEECGEATYAELLADSHQEISAQLKAHQSQPAHAFVGLNQYDPRLDLLLGAAPNEAARATRKLHFDLQANLRYVEEALHRPPDTKRRMEAQMLRAFYEHFQLDPRFR